MRKITISIDNFSVSARMDTNDTKEISLEFKNNLSSVFGEADIIGFTFDSALATNLVQELQNKITWLSTSQTNKVEIPSTEAK